VERNLELIGTDQNFLNRTPISHVLRSRIDKWDLMQLETFCKAKDIVNKTNRHPTDWGKIFPHPTSDIGLIPIRYKELKKLTTKKPDDSTNYCGNQGHNTEGHCMVLNCMWSHTNMHENRKTGGHMRSSSSCKSAVCWFKFRIPNCQQTSPLSLSTVLALTIGRGQSQTL